MAAIDGADNLREMLELVDGLTVLDTTLEIAPAAGELGAVMRGRGQPAPTIDLITAQTTRSHGAILLTRDGAFARIPGLACESY